MSFQAVKSLVRHFPVKSLQNVHSKEIPTWLTRSFATSTYNSNIHIDVSPKEALLDNAPKIRVEGLKENQNVTLWNTYIDDSGLEFSAHAHYVANKDGVIDVNRDMSHGGKYKGIFSEGLVSSMHSAPPVYKEKPKLKWARLFKKNVDQPLKYTVRVVDGHVSESELYSDTKVKSMGETTFLRRLMGEGVRRTEVEDGKVRGTLFLPPGEGPFPVVLDVHGAEPGAKEARAAMLASYGYAAMVLPYTNYKDLPTSMDTLDLNYFLEAIDFLNKLPQGNHGRIGYIGSSKGGEIGITLSGISELIKALITINSYHISVDVDMYLGENLYHGKFIGSNNNMNIFLKDGKLVTYGKTPYYNWDMGQILPAEKVHTDCHVLATAGDNDGCQGYRSALAWKERARKFKKDNISVVVYPGAGHLIDPPFHSHIDAVWNSTILIRKEDGSRYKGLPHLYGGNPYDTCQASKDLWQRALALFHRRLVQEAGLPVDKTRLYPPYAV